MRSTPDREHPCARRPWTFLTVIPAFALALFSCGSARAQDEDVYEDEITQKPMRAVMNIKIVEDSWKVVRAKKGPQAEVPIPAHEVLDVVYADATKDFASGVKRATKGYYTKAIDDSFLPTLKILSRFRKVDGRPWPEQYCLYYLGHCHLMRGDMGDAAEARMYFERLVKDIPNTRFIFQAYLELAETYQVEQAYEHPEKNYKDADRRFTSMSRESGVTPAQAKEIGRLAMLARLRSVQMLDARGEHDRASSAYLQLVSKSKDYPEIQSEARVGAVRTRVATGQYERAIAECIEMIGEGESEGNTEYLGGSYLALADCYFERAGDEVASPEDLVTARWNYLRVATLYFFERKLLAKARFRAARCFEKLAGERGEGKKAEEQAARQYGLVVKEFPESPWAAEAQKSLQALGGGG